MENNDNPINDGKFKLNRTKFLRAIVGIYIILLIINGFNTVYEKQQEKIAKEERTKFVSSRNLELEYKTDFEDKNFNIEKLEAIEFTNGIKIPTLGIYEPSVFVQSFSKKIEDNIVANNSPVINIMYTEENLSSFMILKFKSEVLKRENYKLIHCDLENTCNVYARKEVDDYYSYLIVKEYEITYGATYGDLKIYF